MPLGALRRLYHFVRRTPDRVLHPSRRRSAVGRQVEARAPSQVLILCYGKICRSPYAEMKLSHLLQNRGLTGTRVESAGFFGAGRPANRAAQAAALTRGLDLSQHVSRVIDEDSLAMASLVVVMTIQHASDARRMAGPEGPAIEPLGDLDPQGVTQRDIPDPYGRAPEEFGRVFDRIDRSLEHLVNAWIS